MPEERAAFWEQAMTVARALAALYDPVKMDYEIHGSVVPHRHLHLSPSEDAIRAAAYGTQRAPR
jgi:diadenosine tetraphosphate (Ap4A) HIT family hydrolase